MSRYILKRLAMLIPLLFFISLLVFTLMKIAPGDMAISLLGDRATEETIEQVRAKYGLDKPVYVQYVRTMKNLFTGELQSIYYKKSVLSAVGERMPATLELGFMALVIALLISIPAGIISAVKRRSVFDYTSMTVALMGISVPVFFTGILFIYIFGVWLKVLPVSGYGGHFWTLDGIRHMIMPAVCLSFVFMASTTRLTRSSMLEVMQNNYVRTARAKGVPEFRIIMGHTFRNALIPIVTNVGNQMARIFAGAILTETVFAWPGVGRLAVSAIFRRDEPLVMGVVIILSFIYVVINLLVDLVYGIINPQVRYE